MTAAKFNDRSDRFCIGWGKLLPSDGGIHLNCPVVLTREKVGESAIAAKLLASGQSFPMVCPCECQTCSRAWWDAGRPIHKDGAIITSSH
jgi:hypothetical protein